MKYKCRFCKKLFTGYVDSIAIEGLAAVTCGYCGEYQELEPEEI